MCAAKQASQCEAFCDER